MKSIYIFLLWRRAPQQTLRAHRSLEAYCATLWWRWLVFSVFTCYEAPVEWNRERKTEVLRGKPAPVPLCQPQIPHGPIHDRTRVSAVRDRRLTAWSSDPASVVEEKNPHLHKCENLPRKIAKVEKRSMPFETPKVMTAFFVKNIYVHFGVTAVHGPQVKDVIISH
jgi:hypothetical protein